MMQGRQPLFIALAGVIGLAIAGVAVAVLAGGGDGETEVVVAAPIVLPTAAPTVVPTPAPTPLTPPLPPPPPPVDRTSCAEIRADPIYRSETERLWFIANCSIAPAQASAPTTSTAPGAAQAAPPAPAASGPRTVTVSLCDPAGRGILLFTITSGGFSYRYDATPSGLNIQPADLVSQLTVPNVPPGTYSWQANTLGRSGGLLQTFFKSSDQDRIVSSPFC